MSHTLTGYAPYAGSPQQVPPHGAHAVPAADWRRPATPPAPQWPSQHPPAYHGGQFPPGPAQPAGSWNTAAATTQQPWSGTGPLRPGRRGIAGIAAAGVAGLAVTIAVVVALTSGHGDSHVTANGGVHIPAPPVKSAPAPQRDAPAAPSAATGLIDDTDLPRLLPPQAHVGRVVGGLDLVPIDKMNGPGMFDDDANPAQCVGAVLTAAKKAYARSGVHATLVQALHERDKGPIHSVFNAVSTFGSTGEAAAFAAQQSGVWQGCQANPVVLDPNDKDPMTWNVQDVATRGDMVTARISLTGAAATCQRALVARRNVVIDVTTCSRDVTDTAATLAGQIADHTGSGG